MSGTEWFTLLSISAGLTASCCWMLIASEKLHLKYTGDVRFHEIHKYHKKPVTRAGGVALFLGMVGASIYFGLIGDNDLYLSKWAGIAVLPVLLGGLLEDVTKRISARDRLLLAFLSAAIAHYELGVGFERVDWPYFDERVITQPGVSLLLTIIMVAGVAHSTNIIDGFNGLLTGVVITAGIVFLSVAYYTGDRALVAYTTILIGCSIGFLFFNFPFGKIFLGDGGAYLLGFLLAILSLLLVKRHATISAWFPLLVLAYPVIETIFSILRKRLYDKRPAMAPDGRHLHMLVFVVWGESVGSRIGLTQNSATGAVMWMIGSVPMIPALIWWSNTVLIATFFFGYALLYLQLYVYLNNRVKRMA